MRSLLLILTLGLIFGAMVQAQDQKKEQPAPATNGAAAPPAVVITAESTPAELAKAAFIAQGGEKLRSVQNIVLRGSVQLYPPNSVQSIPGSFTLVTAGLNLRMDIDARPAIVFKQIYNGEQSYSSMPNVQMPPLTKYGLSALSRYDQQGYQLSALPNKKKQRAFRLVDPEGYTTDFYIDPTNGRVMSYMLYYQGLTLGTEHTKFKDMDGVLVPMNFSQKFEMTQGSFFAEFSAKDVQVNQKLAEDAFAIPH